MVQFCPLTENALGPFSSLGGYWKTDCWNIWELSSLTVNKVADGLELMLTLISELSSLTKRTDEIICV